MTGDGLGDGPAISRRVTLAGVRSFVAVASTGSFGRAAEMLEVAQPGVSQRVRALEEAVGAVLFERTRTGVTLTPAGHQFYAAARDALEHLDGAIAALVAARGADARPLIVGYPEAAAMPGFIRTIEVFRARHPEIALQERTAEFSADVLDDLAGGHIDVGFVWAVSVPDDGLRSEVVARERLGAVLLASDPLASRSEIALSDLHEHRLLIMDPRRRWAVNEVIRGAYRRAGLEPPVAGRFVNLNGVYEHLLQGGAFTLMTPRFAARMAGVVHRPLADPEAVAPIRIVWSVERSSPAVLAFVRTAHQVVGRSVTRRRASGPRRAAAAG
jgi:DNA-binding transcriptional LysR family regulator